MKNTISIYDAKTNFSKLVAKAKKGEEVIIGAFGEPEVMLVPYKKKNKLNIGVWDYKNLKFGDDIVGSDPETVKLFDESINRSFPDEISNR
jgi:prevent-host-death family protein